MHNYRVSISLLCLSHNLVYLLYFCPSLDKSFDISKINKQRSGLARKGHRNAVNEKKLYFDVKAVTHSLA